MRYSYVTLSLGLMALVGCGGGSGGGGIPEGAVVDVEGFETYRTDHNGRNRVRVTNTAGLTAADEKALAQFDKTGMGPSGYKDLVAMKGKATTIEVIAELTDPTGNKAKRLLRLTTDEAPLENVKFGRLVTSSGVFYLRGSSYAWATIDGGPMLSGYDPNGLVNMSLDFGAGTATIDLRTGVNEALGSDLRIELIAKDLPFNIVSGAFGGEVTISVDNPSSPEIYNVAGGLRGNVGGSPTYTNSQHGLSTSGLFQASGQTVDGLVTVQGAFEGTDEKAPRPR